MSRARKVNVDGVGLFAHEKDGSVAVLDTGDQIAERAAELIRTGVLRAQVDLASHVAHAEPSLP